MGAIVFDADEAEALAGKGKAVILVRRETSPEDIHGMKAAEGIVTATGGMTSHAAVVARGLGKPCVAGVGMLHVDYETHKVTVRTPDGVITLGAGDRITLDGSGGCIYQGELDVVAAAKVAEFDTLMEWADRERRLEVRANADTPRDARRARAYGAEGIGLCRTEHMFFAEERLEAVRCMALAEPGERQPWLDRLAPMQRDDFADIFRAMDGLPVTIRLLDWPLHEFMPREERDFEHVARGLGLSVEEVRERARSLSEVNPMLGHRGVRVGITTPEIYRMQVHAIADAAVLVAQEGIAVHPEIMIPVVGIVAELEQVSAAVRETMDARAGGTITYHVGTMIELPRACLVAGDLARFAEFFSFGTNDLTQTTFGISRDDSGRFLSAYLAQTPRVLEADPFSRLDEVGVGELVRLAVERGRARRAEIGLGICGEHGGDPRSIGFAHRVGLDYVSCSPPRLPVARLAAAQAALRESGLLAGV
jgi:pyruvate,orthophosphate dikinase